jgi:hypothetical protein
LDLDKLAEKNDDGFMGVNIDEGSIIDAFISPSFKINSETIVLLNSNNFTLSFYSLTYKMIISYISLAGSLNLTDQINMDLLLNGREFIIFINDINKKRFCDYLLRLPEDEVFNKVEIQSNPIQLTDMNNYVKVTSMTFKKVSCIVFAKANELKVILYKAKTRTHHIVNIGLKYIQGGISIYFVTNS